MESEKEGATEIAGNKKRKAEGGEGGGRFRLDFSACLKISKLLFPEKDLDSFEEGGFSDYYCARTDRNNDGNERFARKFGEAMSGSFSLLESLIEENSAERRESRQKLKRDKKRETAELLKKSVIEAFRESDPETARLLESKKNLKLIMEASGGLEDDSMSQYFKGEYWEADQLFNTDYDFCFEIGEEEEEEEEEESDGEGFELGGETCVNIYFTLEAHQEREDGSDRVYFEEPEVKQKKLCVGEYFKNRSDGRSILIKFMKKFLEKELGEDDFTEKDLILREFEDGLEDHFTVNQN